MNSNDITPSEVSFPFEVDNLGRSIVEDVYNAQLLWKYVEDNDTFNFMDGTKAIMRKFQIETSYCDVESVQSTEELRLTCTSPCRPSHASVLIPLVEMPASSFYAPTTFILDCRDCANILKVAPENFQAGDEMTTSRGERWTCSFGFGEVVQTHGRNNKREVGVVVGHTKTRVYLITDGSIRENHRTLVSATPFAKSVRSVEKVQGVTSVFNHTVMKGCGVMEDFVVHNSETAYDF